MDKNTNQELYTNLVIAYNFRAYGEKTLGEAQTSVTYLNSITNQLEQIDQAPWSEAMQNLSTIVDKGLSGAFYIGGSGLTPNDLDNCWDTLTGIIKKYAPNEKAS